MAFKNCILIFICFLIIQVSKAQLNPWWIERPIEDTTIIYRHSIADSIVNYASSFIGVPYVWGGSTPQSGFDCSGFVCYVFKNFGFNLPRTSGLQFDAGIPIPYTEAEAGDIILFTGTTIEGGNPGHVGIVISYDAINGFTFIHTASPETGGVRVSLSCNETCFEKRFLEIRRVIQQL